MKLNIYKNQKEIEKTYEVDSYDIMYGTVQDILAVLDDFDLENLKNEDQLLKLIVDNRSKLEDLLLDIFGVEGLTAEELRKVKLKELVPRDYVPHYAYVYDILEIYINGIHLNSNEYTLSNNTVTLETPIEEPGATVTFVVYKSVDTSNA